MYYPLSYLRHFLLQASVFVYNFYSGIIFAEKNFAVILFCGNLYLRIAKKTAKIAKLRTRKKFSATQWSRKTNKRASAKSPSALKRDACVESLV